MLITTTENIAGHRVLETKGQVLGVVVRSRGLAGNLMAGLRSIIGGEITEYTSLLEETDHAPDLLACVRFERWRYKAPAAQGGQWQRTGEQFIDPESGQATEVFYDSGTGQRRYAPRPTSEQ